MSLLNEFYAQLLTQALIKTEHPKVSAPQFLSDPKCKEKAEVYRALAQSYLTGEGLQN